MMIDISENFFAINNDVGVNSRSYELYSNNTYKKVIVSFQLNSIQNLDLFLNLRVSFGFSLIDQEDFDFEEKNTYYIRDVINMKTGTLDTEVPLENDSTSDLFAYVRIFDEEDPENIYDKLYKEQIINKNALVVNNFVDYSLEDASSFTSNFKDPRTLQEELFEENFNKNTNYSYMTNLFHFFRTGNKVNCFFGIDDESYVKDNNPIKFLNDDIDFNNYIKNNNAIEGVTGYIYADKDHVNVVTSELGLDLKDTLGRAYGFTFEVPKDFPRTRLYGYEGQVSFRDILIQYLNDELLPSLRSENQFLRELDISQSFTTINSAKLSKTISTYSAFLSSIIDNADQIMALFQNSPILVLNDRLRNIFLDVNQSVYNVLLDGIKARGISSSLNETITKDFGPVINPSRIDYGVKVLQDPQDEALISAYSLDSIEDRASQELQKYFADLAPSVEVSGEQVNVSNRSPSVLSSLSLIIEDKLELDNQKSPNDDFSYDESLKYLNTINKIINKNIQKDPLIYNKTTVAALSNQEVATEERTIQNNATLNALTIEQSENLRSARITNNLLSIRENIIKTFEVPSTLRTDLCTDTLPEGVPIEGTTARVSADPENFLGNSLISFGVLNKVKSLKENDFYEPYAKILESTPEQIEQSSIQAGYLFNYYSEDSETPSFLRRENLLGQITSFGINYHNFKSLFSVKIYSIDDREFVPLDRDIINTLDIDRNYLCVIDHHRNINYGMETPELLRTSIYNKYFILTT